MTTEADMEFITGFGVWLVLVIVGGVLARAVYRADGSVVALAITFGIFGAFIGGMLGTSAHVFHDPVPLRIGGIIGSVSGAFIFPFIYQFIGRKAV
jgi:uncharacterized membrane protein YeaQ/YmgE (transglycosylase-associated protein family)